MSATSLHSDPCKRIYERREAVLNELLDITRFDARGRGTRDGER